MIQKLVFAGLLVFLFWANLAAQETAPRFLLLQPSATSQALGGAGTSIHDDAFALYYNPAALGFTSTYSISGTVVKPFPFFGNTVHAYGGAVAPLGDRGTLAVAANMYWRGGEGPITSRGPDPITTESDYQHLNYQLKVGYALPISEQFAVGTSLGLVKYKLTDRPLTQEISEASDMAFHVDLGFFAQHLFPQLTTRYEEKSLPEGLYRWVDQRKLEGVSLGFSLLNMGSKTSFLREPRGRSEKLPGKLNLGAFWWVLSSPGLSLMIASDLEVPFGETYNFDYIHLGGESRLYHLLSLRAGRFVDATGGLRKSYTTLGGGLNLRFMSINVARYNRTYAPTWHYDFALKLER